MARQQRSKQKTRRNAMRTRKSARRDAQSPSNLTPLTPLTPPPQSPPNPPPAAPLDDVLLPTDKKQKREQLVGRRLIRLLDDQLRALRQAPAHGNRTLHADQVVVAHLIAFFNPAIASLRRIEDVFEHKQVQRRVGLQRVPRSTLADTQAVFDLNLLQPLVHDLVTRIGPLPHNPRLDAVTRQIVAVDASVFQVASRIAWATPHNSTSGRGAMQWCLHFDVVHGAPDGMSIIGGGESERGQLPEQIASDRLYLLDRAYQSYAHLNEIIQIDSDFVVRLRKTATFEVLEERPLSAEDRRVGVLRDGVVQPRDAKLHFATPVRLVEIRSDDPDEPVRLLTSRLDLPAELIGLLYRHRWQIELFFRWIKCCTHLKHFFAESANGMALQLYVAMIGTLLIALETGARPSVYDFAQMSLVSSGMVSLEEAKVVMARRRAISRRDAERAAARRAAKKTAQ